MVLDYGIRLVCPNRVMKTFSALKRARDKGRRTRKKEIFDIIVTKMRRMILI